MWYDIKGIEYVIVGNSEVEVISIDNVNGIVILLLIWLEELLSQKVLGCLIVWDNVIL